MFEGRTYDSGVAQLEPGDALVMYSDGITEAESPDGATVRRGGPRTDAGACIPARSERRGQLGQAIFDAVERHRRDQRLADDLSVLVLSRVSEFGSRIRPPASNYRVPGVPGFQTFRDAVRIRSENAACGTVGTPDLEPLLCLRVLLSSRCRSPAFAAPSPLPAQIAEDLSIQALLASRRNLHFDDRPRSVARAAVAERRSRSPPSNSSTRMVPQGVTRALSGTRSHPLLGALPGEGYRLIADVFIETGARGRIATWRLDVRRPRDDDIGRQPWRIVARKDLRRSTACIAWRCIPRSSLPPAIW